MVNANFLTPPQTQLVEVWHSLASVLSIDDLAALLGKPRAGVKRVIDNLNAKGITQTSAQQGQLSSAIVKDKVRVILNGIYTVINQTSSEAEIRQSCVATFMAWLVTSYHGTKAPINIIYQLCPLPLATIKRHLSAKTFEAMASLLLNLQAVPFSSAIEVLWPIALQFAPDATDDQSAVYRKTQGTYLTPRWLARRTIEYAVVSYLKQHGVAQEVIRSLQNDTAIDGRQQKRLALLLSRVTIVDPACGAGVFLSEAFYLLARWQCRVNPPLGYGDCARQLLDHQLYGVDRDPLAVGLTQAVLWFQAAPYVKDSIANIHIQLGDSLLGVPFHKTWQKVPVVLPSDGEAFHWPAAFPNIAAAQGFDIVIGNPPWEKVKLLSREFFEVKQPHLAKISTSAARHSLMDAYRPAYEQEREQRSEYARTIRASLNIRPVMTSTYTNCLLNAVFNLPTIKGSSALLSRLVLLLIWGPASFLRKSVSSGTLYSSQILKIEPRYLPMLMAATVSPYAC